MVEYTTKIASYQYLLINHLLVINIYKMKKLSIVIPAFNEEKTISEIIKRIKSVDLRDIEKEIIVVDNNSKDRTKAIANNTSGVKVYTETIKGKGACVKKGFKEATGDIFIIQDADLEYDPKDYPVVLYPILNKQCSITNGVRIEGRFHSKDILSAGFLGYVGNTLITITTNLLYKNNAKEYEGCYKAITKELARSIDCRANDFDFENELICKAMKKGYKIIDVPIHYYPRSYSDGKKIKWKHGIKILYTIIKTRFKN